MRPARAPYTRRRPRGTTRACAAIAVLAGTAALIAGCGGGGSNPGVANVASTTTTATHTAASTSSSTPAGGGAPVEFGGGSSSSPGNAGHATQSFSMASSSPQNALKLSRCMQANGEPNVPDPNGQGVIQGSGIDPNSPQFAAAMRKCSRYVGGGKAPTPAQQHAAEQKALAFSQCMRAHGVADFPDPQFSAVGGGGIGIRIKVGGPGSSGIDPNSPIFQRAQSKCGSLLPGRIGTATAKQ